MSLLSAAMLLFLVMDPIGNVPAFVSLLADVPPPRARWVIVREMLVALAILLLFLLGGRAILEALQISEPALSIAGGVILFLIALKMIFANVRELFRGELGGEPFIVPLAVPLIAGPSAAATVLLLMARDPARWLHWAAALGLAWLVTGAILLSSTWLRQLLGPRVLLAIERLMGMLLTTVAIQMALTGVRDFLAEMP